MNFWKLLLCTEIFHENLVAFTKRKKKNPMAAKIIINGYLIIHFRSLNIQT